MKKCCKPQIEKNVDKGATVKKVLGNFKEDAPTKGKATKVVKKITG